MRRLACFLSALVLIAGCGGSGGGSAQPSRTETRQVLERGFSHAFQMGQWGVIGLQAPQGDGGGSEPGMGYDDDLGLWSQDLDNGGDASKPTGRRLFVDAEATLPAGHELTWTTAAEADPSVNRYEFLVTAGRRKGLDRKQRTETYRAGGGRVDSDSFDPEIGRFAYSGSWDREGRGEWNGTFTHLDGTWEKVRLVRGSGPGPTIGIETSRGLAMDLAFAANGSGTGLVRFRGIEVGDVVWDEQGVGVIRWRVGGETPFRIYRPD